MSDHFDHHARRADRLARRERQTVYAGGVRAFVALGALAAPIAYVVAADWSLGESHVLRGAIAAVAAAAPFWLLAVWAARWREPRLAPYTLEQRDEAAETSIVRECADDEAAAALARKMLPPEPGASVSVGRGPPGNAVAIGAWSWEDGRAKWRFLTPPRWTFYRRPRT